MITPIRGTKHGRYRIGRCNFARRGSAILAGIATAMTLSGVAASEPIITPERMQEIRARALLRKVPEEIGEAVAVPLGLTTPGVIYLTKQAALRTQTPKNIHYFAVHTGGSDKVLIMQTDGSTTQLWVCDMNGTLATAGIVTNGKFQRVSSAEAQASFDSEMRLWATVTDFVPRPRSNNDNEKDDRRP